MPIGGQNVLYQKVQTSASSLVVNSPSGTPMVNISGSSLSSLNSLNGAGVYLAVSTNPGTNNPYKYYSSNI